MNKDPRLFLPSGLNSQFNIDPNLPFADYLKSTREMISKARIDLTPETAETIINANAPFEFRPDSNASPKQGILLLHGLYASPFICQDLGQYFARQGFLVRSMLLPGHGTVPGDLLEVNYQEWIKAVDYGFETLAQSVDHVFIVGFSLGALLAVHKTLRDKRVQGLGLLAPALGLKNQFLYGNIIRLQKWLRWMYADGKWYKKGNVHQDYAKYESFCCNAVTQIYSLMMDTQNRLTQKKQSSFPVFLAASAQDELISSSACVKFFKAHASADSHFWWYTSMPEKISCTDSRFQIKNSVFTEQKILDFSHMCLAIAPENTYYGIRGKYKDFLGYKNSQAPEGKEIFLGATSRKNLRQYAIQRLGYNPDFDGMVREINKFFKVLSG